MNHHLRKIRAFETEAGESFIFGLVSLVLLLGAAWGWCWVVFG